MTLSLTQRKKAEAKLKSDLEALGIILGKRKKAEDEESAREDRIVEKLLRRLPDLSPKPGRPGKDAEITAEAIIAAFMVETEDGKKKGIPQALIEGLEQTFRSMWNQIGRKGAYLHGGGDSLVAGPGITLTSNSDGTKTISASIANNILAVTGTIDDSNVTFNTTSTPQLLIINGAIYQSTGGAITWSYAAGVITLSSPVGSGGSIFALK